ncbi:MAG: prepilin-type N-terminal cleavage/methylation domain-containing protein [Candidatus Krumholzibacteria bacterium]|nr:prepilin-type N-terminal cleavage/methylation domain-containing protein [Candidatus Krumholzibacteria bacterium]
MSPRRGNAYGIRCRIGAGRRGFTLVEVLVALSVLAVTMTMVFTLFSAGMNLRSVTRESMAFDRDARLVIGALKNDLANLVPSGPEPLVSADSIVLWRQQKEFEKGVEKVGAPQLVTYQWSGSTTQDSVLVRVAAPLAIDVTDSALVHHEFMKWARVFQGMDVTVNYLVREGDGSRFGGRATLNELSGSWLAFPHIQGFAFGITEDPEADPELDKRSQILVRLSPWKNTASAPWQDPLTSLELLTDDGSGVETGLWLPVVAKFPIPVEDDRLERGQP